MTDRNTGFPFAREWQKNIIPMEAGIYIIDGNTGFPFSWEWQNESIYIGITKWKYCIPIFMGMTK